MTQEDKELLLKDLCGRLPYGVKLDNGVKLRRIDALTKIISGSGSDRELEHVKPYLRPMSSMTKEELKELNKKYGNIAYFFIQEPPYYHGLQAQHSDIGSIEISEFSEIYDWLNVHHFDYRGLIEKGLALEAPKDMYNTEQTIQIETLKFAPISTEPGKDGSKII